MRTKKTISPDHQTGRQTAAISVRRLKPGYTQVGANLPIALYREVKKRLPDEELNFSELVEKLLTSWLNRR